MAPRRHGKTKRNKPSSARQQQHHGGWKPVANVGLLSAEAAAAALDANHYDGDGDHDGDNGGDHRGGNKRSRRSRTATTVKAAAADLEAPPHEGVGICLPGGLEVVAGGDYRITAQGHFEVLTATVATADDDADDDDNDENEVGDDAAQAGSAAKKKKKKTSKSTEKDAYAEERDDAADADGGTNNSASRAKLKKRKRRQSKKRNDRSSGAIQCIDGGDGAKKSAASHPSGGSSSSHNNSSNGNGGDAPAVREEEDEESAVVDDGAAVAVQRQWLRATGVWLEEPLCRQLARLEFAAPTPVQAATLAAAQHRNVVGAAPTGSGKTLAFLVPIVRHLLALQRDDDDDDDDDTGSSSRAGPTAALQALVLAPTRELAQQIHRQAAELLSRKTWAGCLTGGLAVAKQARVLRQRPPVLVATPGRLWELISSRDHAHLRDLSQIKFLVIDEADRLVRQGSFPQLARILEAVHRANPMDENDDSDDDESESDIRDDDDDDGNQNMTRLRSLPGLPGEAKVSMLSPELLRQVQEQSGEEAAVPMDQELGDDDDQLLEKDDANVDDSDDDISLPARPPVVRQTFIYSATLTLPSLHKQQQQNSKKKQHRSNGATSVDGALAEILEKAHAKGKTKIVDLTNGDSSNKARVRSVVADSANGSNRIMETTKPSKREKATTTTATSSAFRLPDGLQLQQIKCTQRHKDSHLYAYLMTTVDGSQGPALVFCNSVAGVRRVGGVLQTLGLSVRLLHAQMQQRARFKAVESLKNCQARTVVVATDVAARGLDLPTVAAVIHYDAARTIDTFVHRSGRTARGVGEDAVGCSLSLVASGEDRFHSKIVNALKVKFANVPMDGRLLAAAQERVNIATKVAESEDAERKAARDNQWFREQAAEAGLEVDDDMLDDAAGLTGDMKRDHARQSEAAQARQRLRVLLAQPMQSQRFGKFLSTNSAATQRVVPQPTVAAQPKKKRRRR